MTNLPPILCARGAADIQALLRTAVGSASADYLPSHLLGPSIISGICYDRVGDWHLYADGGDAERVQVGYGIGGGTNFARHAMRTRYGSASTWRARDVSHFNFSMQAFAFLVLTRWLDEPNGAWCMGNLDGPDAADPWLGNGTNYGPNKGYSLSANGSGGIGWAAIGTTGNLNQDTYDPLDGGSLPSNTADLVTTELNAIVCGRVLTGTAGIYHAGYDQAAWSIGSGGTVGDVTSPTPFALWHNYFNLEFAGVSAEWPLICVFEGTAAENLITNRAAIVTALQATLE